MEHSYPLKIAFIGETSLLLACVEIALTHKNYFDISVIHTTNHQVIAWCHKHHIHYVTHMSDFESCVKNNNIDYLFSIVNYQRLSAELLQSVKHMPINFHDALLPAYAGVNATAWAIFHNEKEHGITWHVMTKHYDAGDVLYQEKVVVDADETTLSLNLKCYAAALNGFKAIVQAIINSALQSAPQNLVLRHYYSYKDHLPKFGFIQWHESAEDIIRMLRSCTYGQYTNRFSLVKCVINNKIYYLKSAVIVDDVTMQCSPGHVLSIDQNSFIVGPATQPLKILQLIDDEREQIDVNGLSVGEKLLTISNKDYAQYKEIISLASKHEQYWVKQFLNSEPLSLPQYLLQQSSATISLTFDSLGIASKEVLIVIAINYFYRLANKQFDAATIGFANPLHNDSVLGELFGKYMPLRFDITGEEHFSDLYDKLILQQTENAHHSIYLRDIFCRYTELQNDDVISRLYPPIIIYNGKSDNMPWHQNTQMVLAFSPDQQSCKIKARITDVALKAIIKRWQTMATQLGKNHRITRYPLLTESEYQHLVIDSNQTTMPYPRNKTIAQMFETQVVKTPNNIALVYENTQLSYAELNSRANQLAHYLIDRYQPEPDNLIAVCLPRHDNLLVVLLAVLKSGCAYVPIEYGIAQKRLELILQDCGPLVLMTNEYAVEHDLNHHIESIIDVETIDSQALIQQLNKQKTCNPKTQITGNHLAYVLYTSGTTGAPKGVMIEHHSLINRLCWMGEQYALTATDRVLQKTPYTFDVSVWECFLGLLYGASVILAQPKGHKDTHYLVELIEKESITIMHFVPSMLDVFLDSPFVALPHLRAIFCSGEALALRQVKKCQQKLPAVSLYNLYGPTEATIDVLAYDCNNSNMNNVCIGKPIYNTSCYVLDDHQMPLPVDCIGELYIGGVGVARGYLNNPSLTKAQFIQNPFLTKQEKEMEINAVLYKTGDLVRRLSEGNIEFIGRHDQQIKIHGYRIELNAIESILSGYPGIDKCVVINHEKYMHRSGLIAYCIASNSIDNKTLFDYMQDYLPVYMIPLDFVKCDSFPLTMHGKLDKRALVDRYQALYDKKNSNYIPPITTIEKHICQLWSEVLDIAPEKIGMTDNFFKLGGDSILAIRLVVMLNAHYHCGVKIEHIYQAGCILKLIKYVLQPESISQGHDYKSFSLVAKEQFQDVLKNFSQIVDIFPASYLQSGMLIESAIDKRGTYHDVFSYQIKAPYDALKFQTIWQKLIVKHALLRSAFILSASGYHVAVYENSVLDFHIFEAKNNDKLIIEERLNTFDYKKPGLFRLLVNNHDQHGFDLLFSFHHAIADGWSVASLLAEFIRAYVHGESIVETMPISYGHYVKNEIEATKDANILQFWQDSLSQASITKANLPENHRSSDNSLFTLKADLSDEQVKAIHTITSLLTISPDIIFLYAYLKSLSKHLHSNELGIGLVTHNRLQQKYGDQQFGLFLNTIPFMFSLLDGCDCSATLTTLFNQKITLQKYQKLPYGFMKRKFKLDLYDFAFNFIHFHVLNDHIDVVDSFIGFERTNIPFNINIFQRSSDEFSITITMHDDFANEQFLNAFMQDYLANLSAILKAMSSNS